MHYHLIEQCTIDGRSHWLKCDCHVREDMLRNRAETHAHPSTIDVDITGADLPGEEKHGNNEIKEVPQLQPVGPPSLLIHQLPDIELRRQIASFLTNRCTLCDERRHCLITYTATCLFHFYCIECFVVATAAPYYVEPVFHHGQRQKSDDS